MSSTIHSSFRQLLTQTGHSCLQIRTQSIRQQKNLSPPHRIFFNLTNTPTKTVTIQLQQRRQFYPVLLIIPNILLTLCRLAMQIKNKSKHLRNLLPPPATTRYVVVFIELSKYKIVLESSHNSSESFSHPLWSSQFPTWCFCSLCLAFILHNRDCTSGKSLKLHFYNGKYEVYR